MDYFVKRGDQQFGPYSLATLQQYVAQGNISAQDLARSEAMNDWVAVSVVIGNVPVAPASVFGATPPVAGTQASDLPPKFHWGLVVGLGIVTFGIFWIIWLFVQAAWIRKVQSESKALYYLIGYIGAAFAAAPFGKGPIASLLQLGGLVLFLIAIFSMRSSIEEQYSVLNPAGRSMSGVMTFFFNAAYFQYVFQEMREIAQNNAVAAGAAR